MDKPTERGHWEAEKTPSQEKTSVLQQLPSAHHKLRAKATQNQGSEWSRERSLSETQPTSAVSSTPLFKESWMYTSWLTVAGNQMLFVSLIPERLTLAEYHEQEEIFKLRLGHLKKVCTELHLLLKWFKHHLSHLWEFVFLSCTELNICN